MMKRIYLRSIFAVLVSVFGGQAWAGPNEAKLNDYFDSILREDPQGFESWYPKTKDKLPDNPRALSFDAGKAMRSVWPSTIASAAVASFNSRKSFASIIQTLDDPAATLEWLRNVSAITTSDIIDQKDPSNLKVRFALSMPFLTDLNGFYNLRHFMASDKRLVLRMTQLSNEGPAEDTQMMILVDRNPDQTAFLHMVYVVVLKPEFKNSFLSKFWFNYRTRRNMIGLIERLAKEDGPIPK